MSVRASSRWLLAIAASVSCGRYAFEPLADGAGGSPEAPFGQPSAVPGLSASGYSDDDPEVSRDGLELYFSSNRPGGLGQSDIWRATRPDPSAAWGAPLLVTELSSTADETQPTLCCGDLVMYLGSTRAPTTGAGDIYVAQRASLTASWAPAVRVAELSSTAYDGGGATTNDGLEIFVDSDRTAATRALFRSTRAVMGATWSAASIELLGGEAVDANADPFLAGDNVLLFASNRPGGGGGDFDLWRAERPSRDAPFAAPSPLAGINTSQRERDPSLSADGRTLYFASVTQAGEYDIFVSTR